jgi:membrane-bound metal-dependent hydrolase YbcI (DUF457 family)
MNGRTHALVGANAIWVLPWLGVTDWRIVPLLLVAMVGGLAPDIDAREAEIHDETFNATKLLFINKLFGHRRLFHSFLAAGAWFWLIGRFVPPVLPALGTVFVGGYISHMLVDGLNTKGVCYFYPFDRPIYFLPSFLRSPCGGWADHLCALLATMGLGAFAYAHGLLVWQSVLGIVHRAWA